VIRTGVRTRLSIWHSGIDSTLHEQSEIVEQAMTTVTSSGALTRADTAGLLAVMHDLRARGLRAWVVDDVGRPIVTTAMVQEGEGAAEERRVLGDTLPTSVLRDVGPAARTRIVQETVATDSGRARLYGAPLPEALGAGSVIVSTSTRDLDALLRDARDAAVAAVIVAVLLSMIAGYFLARQSLLPVTAMSQQADRIGAANLHERLPVTNPHDELGRLATTFNRMLDRVDDAFEQQRRFMADASHELRTPVAILRGEADIALSADGRTREEYHGALVVVHDAADRLSRTVTRVRCRRRRLLYISTRSSPILAEPCGPSPRSAASR
jgi:signal transduction histidine kinase